MYSGERVSCHWPIEKLIFLNNIMLMPNNFDVFILLVTLFRKRYVIIIIIPCFFAYDNPHQLDPLITGTPSSFAQPCAF